MRSGPVPVELPGRKPHYREVSVAQTLVEFGSPVTVRTNYGLRCAIHVGVLPDGRVVVWLGRFRFVPSRTVLGEWVCPKCNGRKVWWNLRRAPACRLCAKPSSDMLAAIMESAQNFVAALLDTVEERERRDMLTSALDQAVLSGDTAKLLQLVLLHQWMQFRIKLGREEQERGEENEV